MAYKYKVLQNKDIMKGPFDLHAWYRESYGISLQTVLKAHF